MGLWWDYTGANGAQASAFLMRLTVIDGDGFISEEPVRARGQILRVGWSKLRRVLL